jgi:DMSO reductase anchor subunit
LAGAPAPDYTIPTTRYLSGRLIPLDAVAADSEELVPEHAHFPLVVMLVFTQMALGCFLVSSFEFNRSLLVGGLASLLLRVVSSVFHLGKPQGAWRAFLGLRRSWLSREIIAFGILMPMALTHLLIPFVTLGWLSSGLCALGVYCSVMVYADTRRSFWSFRWSSIRFFGTVAVLGASCWMLGYSSNPYAMSVLLIVSLLKLGLELLQLKSEGLNKSSRLMLGPLVPKTRTRFLFGVMGGVMIPSVLLFGGVEGEMLFSVSFLSWFLLLVGELFERTLFFQAVQAPHMPRGGVR